MIQIAGAEAPIDVSQLSMLERQILQQKQLSPQLYNYDNVEELLFELKLRAATVQAAVDLGRSGARFDTLRKSRANWMYWSRTPVGGFLLNPGVRPSQAIRDIFYNGGLYVFECAAAVIIILYKAVVDVIGDDMFDRYFDNLNLITTNSDPDLGLTTIRTTTEMYPGDILYFNNPDFDRNKPEWAGENVVKVGDNAYFGHGIGVQPAEIIIRDLNRLRRFWARRSAYMLNQATFPNFKHLYSLSKGLSGSTFPARGQRQRLAVGGQEAAGVLIRIGARPVSDSAVPFR
ncbi:protein-glutamine gamma-glutamyltransferase [Paenibacillus koleovorans]|uniref:protein-glutamine gamma-glutamyltransferase n=1 Tax=Paenibacillus koleovorans TaxID=121608 RepID=UPI00158127F3|nr:protein-glutamine gamma-glutamyltransferase [Paenibacillus koleovorans]